MGVAAWRAPLKRCRSLCKHGSPGSNGVVKDPGHPLDAAGKVVRGQRKDVHDGPYAEAKDLVNGYVLIEAATIDKAVELSKGCPIFNDGGSVEVRPILKL